MRARQLAMQRLCQRRLRNRRRAAGLCTGCGADPRIGKVKFKTCTRCRGIAYRSPSRQRQEAA